MLDLRRIGCEMGGTSLELCPVVSFGIKKSFLLPELILSTSQQQGGQLYLIYHNCFNYYSVFTLTL